jgi:very-short-patch-repair endonuclease
VSALAGGQEAMVSWDQLRRAGFSAPAIGRRVEQGLLCPWHRGVYSLGPPRPTWPARLWAALLACGGPGAAVFSHRTAGALWDLVPVPGRIELITLNQSRSTAAIRVHRTRTLCLDDLRRDPRHGLPVTSPMRALLDMATELTAHRTTRAVHRAAELGLLDARQVPSGRPGAARLRAAMATLASAAPQHTKSGLEEAFLQLVDDHHLPPPLTNVVVNGHEVDAHWPHARLVVELDSHRHHDNPAAFEHDRARDHDHVLAGDRVIRLTPTMLNPHTAAKLHHLLAT